MALFRYRALNDAGKEVKGTIDAVDEAAAKQALEELSMKLLQIEGYALAEKQKKNPPKKDLPLQVKKKEETPAPKAVPPKRLPVRKVQSKKAVEQSSVQPPNTAPSAQKREVHVETPVSTAKKEPPSPVVSSGIIKNEAIKTVSTTPVPPVTPKKEKRNFFSMLFSIFRRKKSNTDILPKGKPDHVDPKKGDVTSATSPGIAPSPLFAPLVQVSNAASSTQKNDVTVGQEQSSVLHDNRQKAIHKEAASPPANIPITPPRSASSPPSSMKQQPAEAKRADESVTGDHDDRKTAVASEPKKPLQSLPTTDPRSVAEKHPGTAIAPSASVPRSNPAAPNRPAYNSSVSSKSDHLSVKTPRSSGGLFSWLRNLFGSKRKSPSQSDALSNALPKVRQEKVEKTVVTPPPHSEAAPATIQHASATQSRSSTVASRTSAGKPSSDPQWLKPYESNSPPHHTPPAASPNPPISSSDTAPSQPSAHKDSNSEVAPSSPPEKKGFFSRVPKRTHLPFAPPAAARVAKESPKKSISHEASMGNESTAHQKHQVEAIPSSPQKPPPNAPPHSSSAAHTNAASSATFAPRAQDSIVLKNAQPSKYAPLVSTLRLYAGWLFAWYAFVAMAGYYSYVRDLSFEIPVVQGLFLSPLVASFLLATFLFLLFSSLHSLLKGGIFKGMALLLLGGTTFWYARMLFY